MLSIFPCACWSFTYHPFLNWVVGLLAVEVLTFFFFSFFLIEEQFFSYSIFWSQYPLPQLCPAHGRWGGPRSWVLSVFCMLTLIRSRICKYFPHCVRCLFSLSLSLIESVWPRTFSATEWPWTSELLAYTYPVSVTWGLNPGPYACLSLLPNLPVSW